MAEPLRYSLTILEISLEKMLDLSILIVSRDRRHARDSISDQPSLPHGSHQAKEVARLLNFDLTQDNPMSGRSGAI